MRVIVAAVCLVTLSLIAWQQPRAAMRGGGSSTAFVCETRTNGGSCTCDPTLGGTDPETCAGMETYCHDQGADMTCKYDIPTGDAACTCKWTNLISGGGVVALPQAPATRR
jgi:hypothetical protein